MKSFLTYIFVLLFISFSLTGCTAVGDKTAALSTVYMSATVLSSALLAGCLLIVRKDRPWFIFLFSSVLVVNVGYTALSVSSSLETALWANRISYLGSVFLPLSMLMIILNVTNTKYQRRLPKVLISFSIFVFLIAASPGILPVYYKEVSFAVVNGVSTLVKVYGPLHPLYLLYLLGYFSAMVAIIIRAQMKKTIDTTSHAIIIAIAVLVNIGVWLTEQLVSMDFEFLSISYIISELFLLGVHLVMKENHRLQELVKQVESTQINSQEKNSSLDLMLETPIVAEAFDPESIEVFIKGIGQLTPTEKAIYEAYIARVTTKEIMANMNIKESTLKYHNRNIYGKLGVSTRKELLELHKHIKSVKERIDSQI